MVIETVSPTRSERTHRAILDAAYKLVVAQGFHATSMRQVAEASGLALGSIYNHFSSKEEIFIAILRERHPFHQVVPILDGVNGDSISDYVHNTAQALVAELGDHPDFLNLMLIEVVEFKGCHQKMLVEMLLPKLMGIGEKFVQFQEEIRPIPALSILRAFLGLFFSFYITQQLLADLTPFGDQAAALDIFVDIFLNGVRAGAASDRESS